MVRFSTESEWDYDVYTDRKHVPYGADLGILHILQAFLPDRCSPSTMCTPQGTTQRCPSGAYVMLNHPQMSPEHAQQDMTGAYQLPCAYILHSVFL